MPQPLLDDTFVITIEFNHTIPHYPRGCSTNMREFGLNRLNVSADLPHLCENQRFIEALDRVHRNIVCTRAFNLKRIRESFSDRYTLNGIVEVRPRTTCEAHLKTSAT
jgi:hypothetical protein